VRNRSLVQLAAVAVSATFLLVGALGFVPGITTSYDDLSFAGPDSTAQLVGLFQISVVHNLVHAAFGVVGLLMARSASGARAFLLGGGAVYLLLAVYGVVIDLDSSANVVPVDVADNVLHVVLGVGMLALGAVLGARSRSGVGGR
jgi:hypothetical protein